MDSVHISLNAEKIFSIGSFPVTNALLMSTLVMLLLLIGGYVLGRRFSLVPKTLQNVLEFLVEQILELMDSVLGNRAASEKYFPIVTTIFVFILTSNWLGLLPGVGSVILRHGGESVPLLRSPASDLNFTVALAILSVIMTQIIGIAAIGIFHHGKKYLNFKNPIMFGVGILEFISEFAKIVSLSFRLFGNVFAGEVLLAVMAFLLPYIVPLPFLFLEVFVGFIQAVIFGMLTLVFIAAAITEMEH